MKQLLIFSFLLTSFAGFSQTNKSMRDYTPRTPQLGDTIFENRSTTGTTTLQLLKGLYFAGTTLQYMRGDGSLATFPTDNAGFTNGAGYLTNTTGDVRYALSAHTHTFASLTSKPTTLSGYGITDAYPLTGNPSGYLVSSDISGKQNTITLTTNFTSGAATLVGNTLNIPNYATGGGGGSTTITDNLTTSTTGTALDAHQGFVLKGLIDGNTTTIGNKQPLENQRLSTTNLPQFTGVNILPQAGLTTPAAGFNITDSTGAGATFIFASGIRKSLNWSNVTGNSIWKFQNKSYTIADSADVAGRQPVSTKLTDIAASALTVSAASTLTLAYAQDYIFSGTTATYTLPAIDATKTGRYYSIHIKNRGTGAITVNTASGSTLYSTSAVATYTLYPGEAILLNNDGTYFNLF